MSETPQADARIALSNAARQARYRARRRAAQLGVLAKPSRLARRSRTKRWNDALAEMLSVQTECAAWLDALPDSLSEGATAAALQEIVDLDLDTIAAVQPPLGYGRD